MAFSGGPFQSGNSMAFSSGEYSWLILLIVLFPFSLSGPPIMLYVELVLLIIFCLIFHLYLFALLSGQSWRNFIFQLLYWVSEFLLYSFQECLYSLFLFFIASCSYFIDCNVFSLNCNIFSLDVFSPVCLLLNFSFPYLFSFPCKSIFSNRR